MLIVLSERLASLLRDASFHARAEARHQRRLGADANQEKVFRGGVDSG